jgi:hypothetical protein
LVGCPKKTVVSLAQASNPHLLSSALLMMIDISPWQHILEPAIFCAGIMEETRSVGIGLVWEEG